MKTSTNENETPARVGSATGSALSVAWEVEINAMTCIVFAATEAKARWLAVKGYWNAGYGRKGEWPRPSAARRPHLDKFPHRDKPDGRCWVPEYVRQLC